MSELSIQERIANMKRCSPPPPMTTVESAMERQAQPHAKPVVQTSKKWDMKEAAVQLGIGFKELFAILREQAHFVKVGKNNLPVIELVEKGYFKNELKKFSRGGISNEYTKTYVLPNGMSFLSEVIKKHKANKNDGKS